MAPVRNGRVLFNEIPQGLPQPGKATVYDTSQTIDLDNVPLDGGFLVKLLVLSIDPYQRGKMRPAHIPSYSPAYALGEPLDNYGVGVVLRSENPATKAGDHVYGELPFQEYAVLKQLPTSFRILENAEGLPWSTYVGVLGMPGQTAYHAWHEFAFPQKGEIAFVSGGAGPVGATVIQLAKVAGLKVIASAGTKDKVEFLKAVGADVAFNYKETDTLEVLKKEGPINIYWDNVGGSTLDAALDGAAVGARFIECGMISQYNATEPYPMKNLMLIVGKQLKVSGFIVSSLNHKYLEKFYAEMPGRVARGEIKYSEDIAELAETGQAILDVQTGRNTGKKVIVVARE